MYELKLCFCELEEDTQEAIKNTLKSYNPEITDGQLKELFERNNLGIKIDIFGYMIPSKD